MASVRVLALTLHDVKTPPKRPKKSCHLMCLFDWYIGLESLCVSCIMCTNVCSDVCVGMSSSECLSVCLFVCLCRCVYVGLCILLRKQVILLNCFCFWMQSSKESHSTHSNRLSSKPHHWKRQFKGTASNQTVEGTFQIVHKSVIHALSSVSNICLLALM